MQTGAQILMELKNRRRTILCAASHCFPILPKLPLPGHSLFTFPIPSLFFLSLLLLPVGRDGIKLSLSLSLLPRHNSLLSWLSQLVHKVDSDFETRGTNFQIKKKKRKMKQTKLRKIN